MANDNLAVQQEAMASEAAPEATGSKPDVTKEGRTTAYENCCNAIIALLDHIPADTKDETPMGLLQEWTTGPEADKDGNVRAALAMFAEELSKRIVTFRDTPRSEGVSGSWYVGILEDGSREKFKSAIVPNERSANFSRYKIVLGKYHVEAGAKYVVDKGRRAKDVLVFHRSDAAKDLGCHPTYAEELNA